jgi:hypothetical protein
MNVKDEISKAIGVVRARMDYIMNYECSFGDFPEDEYNALCKAVCSLEKWRDDSETHNIPQIAERLIGLK